MVKDGNVISMKYIEEDLRYINFIKSEKDEYYYGIAADWAFTEHKRRTKTVFKLDDSGNKVFVYNIFENNSFSDYLEEYSLISDIAVNNNFIFLSIINNKNDVYILDLNGDLKGLIGYSMNSKLNNGGNSLSIGGISATDEGIYIVGMIHKYSQNSQMFIDKISNDYNFEYRINVPEIEESRYGILSSFYEDMIASNGVQKEETGIGGIKYDKYKRN